ncbi:MAG: hypothetical protein AAF654_03225 [Myxococcota bacterium]
MARESREVWAKRVELWKDSGLTAREFAAEVGINHRTLTYWKYQLSKEAKAGGSTVRPEPGHRKPEFVAARVQATSVFEVQIAPIERRGKATLRAHRCGALGMIPFPSPVRNG